MDYCEYCGKPLIRGLEHRCARAASSEEALEEQDPTLRQSAENPSDTVTEDDPTLRDALRKVRAEQSVGETTLAEINIQTIEGQRLGLDDEISEIDPDLVGPGDRTIELNTPNREAFLADVVAQSGTPFPPEKEEATALPAPSEERTLEINTGGRGEFLNHLKELAAKGSDAFVGEPTGEALPPSLRARPPSLRRPPSKPGPHPPLSKEGPFATLSGSPGVSLFEDSDESSELAPPRQDGVTDGSFAAILDGIEIELDAEDDTALDNDPPVVATEPLSEVEIDETPTRRRDRPLSAPAHGPIDDLADLPDLDAADVDHDVLFVKQDPLFGQPPYQVVEYPTDVGAEARPAPRGLTASEVEDDAQPSLLPALVLALILNVILLYFAAQHWWDPRAVAVVSFIVIVPLVMVIGMFERAIRRSPRRLWMPAAAGMLMGVLAAGGWFYPPVRVLVLQHVPVQTEDALFQAVEEPDDAVAAAACRHLMASGNEKVDWLIERKPEAARRCVGDL